METLATPQQRAFTPTQTTSGADALLERVDFYRLDASRRLATDRRAELGQFFTPPSVSRLMASMVPDDLETVRVLDAGAGVGSLCAGLVAVLCARSRRPRHVHVMAYEIESALIHYLRATLDECTAVCAQAGIDLTTDIRTEDFIRAAVSALQSRQLFLGDGLDPNLAILNPPYRKLNTDSEARRLLRLAGIETSNLYAAFLWLAVDLLAPEGHLVAITPRSFCNGPYFRPFRRALARSMSFRRIHVFESRKQAFRDDDVLQENVIFHAAKSSTRGKVTITTSVGADEQDVTVREVDHDRLFRPRDQEAFIHIVTDELGDEIAEQMRGFDASLDELGLDVSTGRVVDFRATELLRSQPGATTIPLIYPAHLDKGFVAWPNTRGKKPNALISNSRSESLVVPADFYVLVKRFSAKEEPRRVVAAVHDPARVPGSMVAFENHLNYFHRRGRGLSPQLAKGLATFLNSTMVDAYFRQFNGHTQVNAADLRNLRYPSASKLMALGARIGDIFPDQDALDRLIHEELFKMAKKTGRNPVQARKRIKQALDVLKALGVPREQQNERSALTLLALLDIKPTSSWPEASDPPRAITEMMDYFRDHFGKTYAPNTRETVRRFTIHQFVQIGLVLANPDNPERPVNSPDTRYRIEPSALKLLQTFGTDDWDKSLEAYLATAAALNRLHPAEREKTLVPVVLPDGR